MSWRRKRRTIRPRFDLVISIGIDAGGTFTDFVVYDPLRGRIDIGKVTSTPHAPQEAVIAALAECERIAAPIHRVVHGTTVGTNALLERKGARVALLTTRGFRDTLEIGRTRRPEPGLFNTKSTRPAPLIPRTLRLEIDERMLADGSVLRSVDHRSVRAACDVLRREKPEAVVVCLLHSYVNAAHEREVRDAVRKALPGLPVQISSEILPEYREFERLSTAVINAYILPFMERYLSELGRHAAGREKRLYVMSSNGGTMTAEVASAYPVSTFLSGPAGGVQGAIKVCQAAGLRDFVTCDMGGTSTDVCLVQDLQAELSRETMIAGLPLKLPQIEINTVGAGGGSIAFLDTEGMLRVGPQSAGAIPGPACYGRGGKALTVTDAAFLLGRIGQSSLVGGRLALDRRAAREAAEGLAAQAGHSIEVYQLLEGVIRLAVAKMASAIREISVERGHDPRTLTLVPMGGAGPMYATEVATELGVDSILVPVYPGNMSALGLVASDLRYDLVRTHVAICDRVEPRDLSTIFGELHRESAARLKADGFAPDAVRHDLGIDLRYHGQAYELTVPMQRDDEPLEQIIARFEALYERRYGLRKTGKAIEMVALRVTAFGAVSPLQLPRAPEQKGAPATRERRSLYWSGDWHPDSPVFDRATLGSGARVPGPAIIEEYGSTTVILPGWDASVDSLGNILITRGRGGE
jgi:N-methylhydantoinase A